MEHRQFGKRGTGIARVDSVRCLQCGDVYPKPAGPGTVRANPGCPECGYLGWLAASIPFMGAGERHRSAADPLRRRTA